MLIQSSQMSLVSRRRKGRAGYNYLDFVIDGRRLSDIDEIGKMDVVSCLDDVNSVLAKESWLALTLQHRPEERILIYLCPICADIGCGAVEVAISRTDHHFVWKSFSYVNGSDAPTPLPIGPFKFESEAYLQALIAAPNLLRFATQ